MTARKKGEGRQPRPKEIRDARERAGLSRADAAPMIYVTVRAWEKYETGERRMPAASWELWLIKLKGEAAKRFGQPRHGH